MSLSFADPVFQEPPQGQSGAAHTSLSDSFFIFLKAPQFENLHDLACSGMREFSPHYFPRLAAYPKGGFSFLRGRGLRIALAVIAAPFSLHFIAQGFFDLKGRASGRPFFFFCPFFSDPPDALAPEAGSCLLSDFQGL